MFFIPLSQVESVDLVIHALRIAAGEADCSSCPARKVCMKQCLTIASAVSNMVEAGTLPCAFSDEEEGQEEEAAPATVSDEAPAAEPVKRGGHLKIVK